MLSKDVNKKHRNNLIIGERKAVEEIKNDTSLKVDTFDNRSGLVSMKEEEAIMRIKEQIGKSNVIDYGPTTTLVLERTS